MKNSISFVKKLLRDARMTAPVTDKKIMRAYSESTNHSVTLACALTLLKVGAFVDYHLFDRERVSTKRVNTDYYNPFDSLDKAGF